MFPQIVIKHNIGNTITVPNQLDSRAFTYLSTNQVADTSAISLAVDSTVGFSAAASGAGAKLLLLGALGAENCEIVRYTSLSSNTTFLLTGSPTNVKLFHNRGDLATEIKYDQVSVYKSSTINGSYTLLETKTFQVSQQNTIFYDIAGLSTDYYKVQWKNSITSDLSSFSEPISVLAYPENSVAEIIYPVLSAMGVSENDAKINTTFCIKAVDDARKFAQAKLYGIRHAWLEEFEHPIKVLAGSNYVDLPDNIDFTDTDRSILAARFLLGNVLAPFNLRYIDKRSWNQVSFNVQGGINEVAASIGAVTLTLDSVGDFPDTGSGVAYVATTDYDQTIMQIAYTGVDLVTNQLTGVTGVTRAIPAGTRVWSNPSIAQPVFYTVYEGRLYFNSLIPDSMQGNNLYVDFYKKLDKVVDLYQELAEPYREIYKWYLKYAIKYRKDITLSDDDPDLKKFGDLLQALFNNLYTGQATVIETY